MAFVQIEQIIFGKWYSSQLSLFCHLPVNWTLLFFVWPMHVMNLISCRFYHKQSSYLCKQSWFIQWPAIQMASVFTNYILLALHKTFQTHKNICKYTNVRQQIYLEIFYFVVSTLFACCFLKWQPEKPNQREKSHGNVMEWQLYIFSSLCYDLLFRLPLFFNDVNERIFNDWRYIFACWLHTEVWYTFFTLYF